MRTTATLLEHHSGRFLCSNRLEQPAQLQQPILIVTACLVLAAFAWLLSRWCCAGVVTQVDHSRPLIDSAGNDDFHQAITILSPFASLEAQTQNWTPESAGSTSQHIKHHEQQTVFEVKHGMASTATESTTERQLAATKLLAHGQYRVLSPGSLSSSGSNHYFEYNLDQPQDSDAHGPGKSGMLLCHQVQERQENIPPVLAEIQPYQELYLPQPNTSDNLVHPLPGQLTLSAANNIASVAQRVSSPHLPSVPLPMPETTVKTEPEATQQASGHLTSLTTQWSSGSFGAEVKEENQLASARNSLSSVTSSNSGFAMPLRQTCPASGHWHALASVPEGEEPSFAAGLLVQKPVTADQELRKQDGLNAAAHPGLCITPFHGQFSKMTAAELVSHGVGDKANRIAAVSDVLASDTSPMQATIENVHNVVLPGNTQRAADAGKANLSKAREGFPTVTSSMDSKATACDVALRLAAGLPAAAEQMETENYPALTVQTAVAISEAPDMPWELQSGSTVADRIQSLASLAVHAPQGSPIPSLQVANGSPTSETRELGVPLMLPTPIPSLTTTSMLREGILTRENGSNVCSATTVSGFEVRHASYRPPPSPVRRSLLTVASLTPPATDSYKP